MRTIKLKLNATILTLVTVIAFAVGTMVGPGHGTAQATLPVVTRDDDLWDVHLRILRSNVTGTDADFAETLQHVGKVAYSNSDDYGYIEASVSKVFIPE